jgi:hypothetical protein
MAIIFGALSSWSAEAKLKNWTLILDYRVRWNTTYLMLVRFWNQKQFVNLLTSGDLNVQGLTKQQNEKLNRLCLDKDDWDIIRALLSILEPFYDVTKHISGRNYQTLSLAKAYENILLDAHGNILRQHHADSPEHVMATLVINSLTKYLHIKSSPKQQMKNLVSVCLFVLY